VSPSLGLDQRCSLQHTQGKSRSCRQCRENQSSDTQVRCSRGRCGTWSNCTRRSSSRTPLASCNRLDRASWGSRGRPLECELGCSPRRTSPGSQRCKSTCPTAGRSSRSAWISSSTGRQQGQSSQGNFDEGSPPPSGAGTLGCEDHPHSLARAGSLQDRQFCPRIRFRTEGKAWTSL